MAENGQKPRKNELVQTLSRRIGRLPKADLEALVEAIESGAVDLEKLARDARAANNEDGPPFGFQRRLQGAKKR